LKTAPTGGSVDEFFESLPADRVPLMTWCHDTIRRLAPELDVKLWGKIVGYGQMRFRYASGKEGDWFPIGLANQKQYVSLYVCIVEDGAYLAEARASKLGKVKVGRSCINMKKLSDLNLVELEALLVHAVALIRSGSGVFGL
jgi:hypothetical protein